MNADVELLYHHGKKPYISSSFITETAQLFVALARLVALGFVVDTDGQRLKVAPATLLTPVQRGWIADNKTAIVAAVSTPCWRWCVETDSGARLVCDCVPAADWRTVALDYFGATVWPAPDGLDVAAWIEAGMPSTAARRGDFSHAATREG